MSNSAVNKLYLLSRLFALWSLVSIVTVNGQTLEVDNTHPEHIRAETIVLGRVAKDPAFHLPRMQELATYLSRHLREYGITRGRVEIARDNFQMIQYLRHGVVDVVSETPLSACMFAEEAQTEMLLREWEGGVAFYSSVFFTRKDSPILKLSDLQGKSIAFEDPGSTSAFLLPVATLMRSGFPLQTLSSPKLAPSADTIGYVFAGDEFAIAVYVHRGISAAGAFSNVDWIELGKTTPQLRNELRIFHVTAPVIRSVILVRNELKSMIKSALTEIFVNMTHDEKAEKMLSRYYNTKKYDPIIGDVKKRLDESCATYRAVRNYLK